MSLRLFDLGGRLVRTLQENRWTELGDREVSFERAGMAPGVYLYRVELGGKAIGSGRLVLAN